MHGTHRSSVVMTVVAVGICLAMGVAPDAVQAQEHDTRVHKPVAKVEKAVDQKMTKAPSLPVLIMLEYQGRVLRDRGAPLPGIEVTLSGPATYTATTDKNGVFHFKGIKPGLYKITMRDPSNVFITPAPATLQNLWTLVRNPR